MGRMTRAKAAAVANTMHIEEDDVLELPSEVLPASDAKPATPERAVLGEIAPNSSESKTPAEIVPRKTRGRKKKAEEKAARSDEQAEVVGQDSEEAVVEELNGEPNGEEQTEEDAQAKVNQTEDAQVEDDSLDITTNETMERLAKLRITSIGNQSVAQTTSPVQLEQSEIPADAPEVEGSASPALDEPVKTNDEESLAPVATPAEEQSSSELPSISIDTKPQQEGNEAEQPEENIMLEAPGSPVATAVPKVIKDLRMETPGKRSTSNKENVEPIEPVGAVEAVESAQIASPSVPTNTQPVSPSQNASVDAVATESTTSPSVRRPSSSKSEDPIDALDELEDAVEKVNSEIPDLTSSPKRSEKATDDKAKPADEKEKPKKVKPAPVVRLTKATQARLSLAQGGNKDQGKASATARPRPSTTLGRASSVRQSVVPSAARRDPKSTSTTNKPDSRPKKETVIPHSKPRPVSLSFPTPPPAARSSKAPTKSTFQLPGEAVAAKLKAAREERLKREANLAASKSNDKASAAATEKKPAFKARPVPSTLKATPSVRQTAASRARESTMNGGASTTTTTKRPTSTINATKPRPSTTAPAPKSSQPSLTISKRLRPSSVQIPATSATTTTRNPSSSSAPRSISTTSKGKEVFARAAAAKEAAEASKREKEDAARKARAAAAERGRAASREWAEKQKAKKAAAAVPGGAPAAAAGAVGGESEVVAA